MNILATNVNAMQDLARRTVADRVSDAEARREARVAAVERRTARRTAHAEHEPVLRRLPDRLRASQAGFAQTGGMHAVGIFTADGDLVASREDVGRHNAMDKLVGAALLADELPWSQHVVLLSGRASFELLQKAMMAGAPVVAAGPGARADLEKLAGLA